MSDKIGFKRTSFKDRQFIVLIMYEGPWERLSGFCYGLRADGTQRWDVPRNPSGWKKYLARLGDWFNTRDMIWRAKYVCKRQMPPRRWERRVPSELIDDDTEA